MSAVRAWVIAALGWLCWGPAARADAVVPAATRPVRLAAERCGAGFVQQLDALLRIELGPRMAGAAPPAQPARDAIAVALACNGDQLVAIASAGDGRERREPIALAQTPLELRPRVAALRVAELVRALDQALALVDARAPVSRIAAPRAPAAAPDTAADSATASFERAEPWELALLAYGGAFHGDGTWLWGAALALDHALGPFAVGAGLVLAQRNAESALGETATFSAQLAPHVLWSLGAGRWRLRAGAGCALGLVRVAAEPRPGAGARPLTAPWVAPHALAVLDHAFTPALALQLRAAAGGVALPVVAQVERGRDIALRGLYTELQLGLALGW